MNSIVLGKECNNECLFCSIRSSRCGGQFQKNTKEICGIMDEIARTDCSEIQFTGGEPTIRLDIEELTRYAARRFEKVCIDTNGRSLKEMEFLKKMVLCGAKTFAVTILGTKAETHDYLTQKSGSFEETILGLKNASELKKEHDFKVVLEFILTKQNMPELKKLNSFIEKFSFDFLTIAHVKPVGRAEDNFLNLHPRYAESRAELDKMNIRHGFDIFNIPPCMLGRNNLKHLVLPPKIDLFFSKTKKESIKDYYNRASVKKSECSKCVFDSACPGVWKTYAQYYSMTEFRPVNCKEKPEYFNKN